MVACSKDPSLNNRIFQNIKHKIIVAKSLKQTNLIFLLVYVQFSLIFNVPIELQSSDRKNSKKRLKKAIGIWEIYNNIMTI